MPKPTDQARIQDPRHVLETFVNQALSIYVTENNVLLTLGVERPAEGAKPGPGTPIDREVVVRLVMPTSVAKQIAKAIEVSLGPLGQTSMTGRSN